jgi:hypothetical protein
MKADMKQNILLQLFGISFLILQAFSFDVQNEYKNIWSDVLEEWTIE